ncbi:putative membrane protein [Ehrlichia chaffeensis str. Liberty]|nr:putative membrane protein [Ehrlichia chaffeensis str. Jax]AHX06953.1 putative membrane protein [Ehrlichia chaffeensis str. Liberty]AHX09702.1 putative membrane protein [Ehrlichia chaffeensis str. Wakulla]
MLEILRFCFDRLFVAYWNLGRLIYIFIIVGAEVNLGCEFR